jgi:hypothetical protein
MLQVLSITRKYIPVLFAVLLILSQTVLAGPRSHDEGFFLRLSAGGGPASTKLESGGEKVELSGSAADVNFAIGAIVSPNLAVHGTLFGWLISDPDVEITGLGSEQANADVDLSGFGAGLTYYFMPANVYVSGTIGAGTLSIDGVGGNYESDTGILFDLTVGKEWWVGNRWGLGVAGGFGYHSIPETDIEDNWSGTSFAIRFSATYN